MAPIGIITSKIDVAKQVIRGSDENLNGNITLKFIPNGLGKPASDQELFGPLRLTIVLQGQAKLKVLENRTSHAYILFWEIRTLFRKSEIAFDGPFRAPAFLETSYPFSISFPKHTDHYKGFCTELPPNFQTRIQAKAVRQAGKHQGAAWLEYALHVEVEMPGISVDIKQPPEISIRYEPPSLPLGTDKAKQQFERSLTVQTYRLLPEDDRPTGIFDRTMASMKNVPKPTYGFHATCFSVPEILNLGSPMVFEVRIRPDIDAISATATVVPDITLGTCEVEILARTRLFATNEYGNDSPKLDHIGTAAKLSIVERVSDKPFSKANDFTHSLTTAPVPLHLPTSFRVAKLARTYLLRIVLRFQVSGQAVEMKKELPVAIVSAPSSQGPQAQRALSNTNAAGPSRPRLSLPDDDYVEEDVLPAYESAGRPPPLAGQASA